MTKFSVPNMWPKHPWLDVLEKEIDYATQAANNKFGEECFIPNLDNTKDIFSLLTIGRLPDPIWRDTTL